MVIFTCNHCPTSQYYEERIKKLVSDYKDKGVGVVAISPNDPASVRPDEMGYTDLGDTLEEMKIRARDRQFNFPYLLGGGKYESVARAYGAVATPHAFIFDQARKLQYVGRIDDSEREKFVRVHDVRVALDAMLAGKEVPVKENRVFRLFGQMVVQGRGHEEVLGQDRGRTCDDRANGCRRNAQIADERVRQMTGASSDWSTSGRPGAGRVSPSSRT